MPDSGERPATDETPPTTEWRRVSAFYRRPPGVVWLICLVAIPLLLGAIGYAEHERSRSGAAGLTDTMPTQTSPPATPETRSASATTSATAPPSSAPGAPTTDCAHLQQAIGGVLPSPITFDTNGFTLTPDDEHGLTLVADQLKACPGATVAINGYGDDTGGDPVNVPLSESRAKSVADFLIGKGVLRDHLTSRGFGSADPAGSNDTPEGRAKNRRVEIVVS